MEMLEVRYKAGTRNRCFCNMSFLNQSVVMGWQDGVADNELAKHKCELQNPYKILGGHGAISLRGWRQDCQSKLASETSHMGLRSLASVNKMKE